MQYLLNVYEYNELKTKADLFTFSKDQLQDFCSMVADTTPIYFWENKEPKVWGCLLTGIPNMGYCDECPAKKLCPSKEKEWSK